MQRATSDGYMVGQQKIIPKKMPMKPMVPEKSMKPMMKVAPTMPAKMGVGMGKGQGLVRRNSKAGNVVAK